jgi:drug/metabolite transporter (DMT)-like permease
MVARPHRKDLVVQSLAAINRTMTPLEWGMLIALSLLWGGSFFFVGVALAELPPFTVVVLRVGIAAIVLNLLLAVMGLRMPMTLHAWIMFFGLGVLSNALPFCLIVWGQTQIASGLASILNATTPLFTVLVAHALTDDEKMSANRLAGVLIGFAGVAVLIGPAALAGAGTNVLAQLACIGAAITYAFAGVYGRRIRTMGMPPLVATTGMVTASTLLLIPIAIAVDRPWMLPGPGATTWGAVAGLAVLSTALAYLIYFRILATAGATNLMLVTFLIPVSAILLGALVLGERLAPQHFLGMALIGAGLAAIDGRLVEYGTLRPSKSAGRGIASGAKPDDQ